MKHSTKFWIKLALAIVVWLVTFLFAGRLGVGDFRTAAALVAGWIVFWVLWPRVWYFSETTKGEIVGYNVVTGAIILLLLIFG